MKLLERETDYTSLLSDPVHVCLELHLQSPYLRFLGVFRRVTIKLKFSRISVFFLNYACIPFHSPCGFRYHALTIQHVMCTPRICSLTFVLSICNVFFKTLLSDIVKLRSVILSPMFFNVFHPEVFNTYINIQ